MVATDVTLQVTECHSNKWISSRYPGLLLTVGLQDDLQQKMHCILAKGHCIRNNMNAPWNSPRKNKNCLDR